MYRLTCITALQSVEPIVNRFKTVSASEQQLL
jgi:hypothetical protein